jgi:hypothetical protein
VTRLIWRSAAALTAASVFLAACGGDKPAEESSRLTPAEVQRFIAVKGAIDNLTRVLQLVSTADGTVDQLLRTDPASKLAVRLASGADLGWNNVVVGLNAFTPTQAGAVEGLANSVGTTRAAAIAWQNSLGALEGRVGDRGLTSGALAAQLAAPQKKEVAAKKALRMTAATLAQMACDLEASHPELAPEGAARSDCAAAANLTG